MGRPQRIEPGPGQESVWDYPRPPRLEPTGKRVQVYFNGELVADTTSALRVLETSHPPGYYIPPADVRMEFLQACEDMGSHCEWKGAARYYTVEVNGARAVAAAWYYPDPAERFAALKDYVAFYPGKMEACLVDGERAEPQAGGFYGGWVTKDVVGPFKGAPGSWGW